MPEDVSTPKKNAKKSKKNTERSYRVRRNEDRN